ncbi:MAG: hypothetical protein IH919_06630 [Deltaproteobacteria bacterium]|nr:hypothetical protein [Deltaproteobacteria bacterium]MCH7911588.1 hypothetical protein [Deltaproteobacteria bacterium]MCZ6451799.1 hypothetical protein [Deltaproteobacteria bacterium]
MALRLALRELQNIHPYTYVQGVLWYGVKHHSLIAAMEEDLSGTFVIHLHA